MFAALFKNQFFAVLITFFWVCAANAQTSYDEKINRYYELRNTFAKMEAMKPSIVKSMTPMVTVMHPNVPAETLKIFREEFKRELSVEITKSFKTYFENFKKFYSEAEVEGLIDYLENPNDDFEKTPLGLKRKKVTPTLKEMNKAAGREWGRKVLPATVMKIVAKMKSNGIPFQ